MKVKIILKSKEGLCVELNDICTIDETDNAIIFGYRLKGQKMLHPVWKKEIKHIKAIPGKEE